ncbi:MAG TPA: hypothetical protein V6D33_11980 [Cyanophyceae cyanobacterium]
MVQLKGSAIIEVRDSRTGELKDRRSQGNVIFEQTLLGLLGWEVNANFGIARISISTQQTTPTPTGNQLTEIIGTGAIPSGVNSPVYYPDVVPPFGEIRNIINAVGTPRTFYTVGLTTLSSGDNQASLTSTAFCYLLLSLPCTQGQFDFLDIYYRIEFLGTGQRLTQKAFIDFGGGTFGRRRFKISHLSASFAKLPTQSYKDLSVLNQKLLTFYEAGFTADWTNGVSVASHFKWKQTLSQGETWQIGTIMSLMLAGDSTDRSAYRWEQYPKTTPIQNGFFQKAGSNKPFFDPVNFGSSQGKIFLSEAGAGSWGDRFPELYQVQIVASGTAGVATYRFRVRKHLGFNGNAYSDLSLPSPFRNNTLPAATGMHGYRIEDNDPQRFSATQIVQYDLTGVTLLNLMNGNYQNWDATTTPALPCSQIRQVATDGVKIWVGDRSAGLYEIDPIANTVTQRIGAQCYGVDVGRGGKVWALVEGGLRNSDAWLTNLTFTYTGISDSNWSKVQFLKADPENGSDRLALITDIGSSQYQIVWWSTLSANGIAGTSSSVKPWPSSFDVSDVGGFWASNGLRHTWGNASIVALNQIATQPITHSIWGADNFYKVSFYNQYLIAQNALVDQNNAVISSYSQLPGSTINLHMDGGIILLVNTMRQLFTDNAYCWQQYGWNGAAWELDNANAKTSHLADQPLINGLQLKFQDGATAPHFFATDFFSVAVCHGLLKDSATTFYWQSAWYTKPVFLDVAVPGGVTIPVGLVYTFPAASDPNFIFMETDSPKLYKFAIAGTSVPTVYTDGTTNPAPGEVTINSAGFAKFNAADVGKTFTGTYAWIGYS